MFQIHADGPGSPIGSGGRYDSLLGRFGAPRAAAGFALSLDHLAWALESIGREETSELRLLTVGASESLLTGLRNLGVPCAQSQAAVGADALAYARAWRFSHVLEVGAQGVNLISVVDEQKRSVLLEPEALVSSLGQLPLGSA
jgi:ATP phosphoribosyltransferase regulatory subunit